MSWSKIITFPLSLLYRIFVYTRNKLYDNGFIKQKELDNNIIISVGNISSGGTGKTPLVELIADYLLEKGKFLVIVLKGYMRKHDDIKVVELGYDNNKKNPLTTENFGDEGFIFLENLKNKNGRGLIIVGDDKTRAAKFAHAKFKPEVIIIDDGFQHRKLIRDLDIVILDGNEGKYLIPAGKLREPLKNKIRADIVVINEKFMETRILQNLDHHSSVTCNYVSGNFKNINNEEIELSGKKVIAFCGIGDPGSFIKMMKRKNIIFNKLMEFADHHNYNLNDLNKIIAAFRNENADAVLTTQKDFVRLSNSETVKESETDNLYKQFLYNYPLYYAKIKMQITRNQELLFSHLDKVVRLV